MPLKKLFWTLLLSLCLSVWSWTNVPTQLTVVPFSSQTIKRTHQRRLLVQQQQDEGTSTTADETTQKFGLEAGLFQAAKEKDSESAKSLLQKYGIAYLATSIPLALLSFAICYALVDAGVDVGELLAKVGIETNAVGEKAGTFAIAYAAHKAASPIRFPPTVLLTPIVARWIGKEPNVGKDDDDEEGVAATKE